MQRSQRSRCVVATLAFVLCGLALSVAAGEAAEGDVSAGGRGEGRLNVLFFAVDDLRPETGGYGNPIIKTPHIDELASRGTLFCRAYCQQAVCSPSRTSLLTGRRPDTTGVYDLQTHFRLNLPDVVTLPQHFKQCGYHTQGFGKIYHGGLDDPHSWSVPHWSPPGPGYGKPETLTALDEQRKQLRAKYGGPSSEVLQRDAKTGAVLKRSAPKYRVRGPAWEDPDVADAALPDGKTAARAIRVLRQVRHKPFFLAVGFLKPHLPFVAPKKYYELYQREELHLATNPFPPKDVPAIAMHNWGELRNYSGIPPRGSLSDAMALDLVHGYYAATSYVDAQIGRVLDELDRLGLREKTVIVLWGDHGWQLGEHGLWCKHTNFEIATRVPLIFSAPAQKQPGAKTDALAEFVDIYPTLCDLCSLPIPDGLEGTSLAPVMEDPKRAWKTAALSQYPRGKVMGYSMRTDRYRYTEWLPRAGGAPVARELYDHRNDPQENVNLAGLPESAEMVSQLSRHLKAGWRAARPAP
ncbi:MAG: sulfatase [Pirellulales bacterium]|nr:sulfatase [Pirellulales bacterium]